MAKSCYHNTQAKAKAAQEAEEGRPHQLRSFEIGMHKPVSLHTKGREEGEERQRKPKGTEGQLVSMTRNTEAGKSGNKTQGYPLTWALGKLADSIGSLLSFKCKCIVPVLCIFAATEKHLNV